MYLLTHDLNPKVRGTKTIRLLLVNAKN